MAQIVIVMGSDADLPVLERAFAVLRSFPVTWEARVMSAHRTPTEALEFARTARASGVQVIIAAAGKAAHLAGVMAKRVVEYRRAVLVEAIRTFVNLNPNVGVSRAQLWPKRAHGIAIRQLKARRGRQIRMQHADVSVLLDDVEFRHRY